MAVQQTKTQTKTTRKVRHHGAVQAHEVEPEPIEFLWRDRIPKGKISVVAGLPDQGKGLLGALIAADVSSAGGNVLFSAAEDDFGSMTRPRLEAAGADLKRVLLWRFILPDQLDELRAHVIDNDVKLVVIDPFSAHLRGINKNSDKARTVTGPLTELAEDTGAAIIIVEHALKTAKKNANPLNAVGGTALPQAARMGFILGRNPENSDEAILVAVKHNIRSKPKALVFEYDSADYPIVGEVPSLVYQGEDEFDAKRLLGEQKDEQDGPGRPPTKRAEAAEWLTKYLAAAGQPVKAGEITKDAQRNGLTSKTLRNAAKDMGVVKSHPNGGKACTWDLPPEVKAALGLDKGKGGGANG